MVPRQTRLIPTIPVIAAAIALGATPAAAKPEKGKVFGDWTIECEQQPDGKSETCFASQSQVTKDGNSLVVHASVGYFGPKGGAMLHLVMPLGIALSPGVGLKIGTAPQIVLPVQECLPRGCVTSANLEPKALEDLLDAKTLAVGVLPFNSPQTLTIPLSTNGLKAAVGSLK